MRCLYITFICILINSITTFAADGILVSRAWKETMLSGYTRSEQSQTISSEVDGKVLKVNYDVGQVTGSRAFIEIDPVFIDHQIESTAESIDKMDIVIRKGTSSVSYLEKEYLRLLSLFRDDLATEADKDSAEQKLDQAMYELESSEKEKAVLQTKLDELRERKKRHSIYPPEGWVVTGRSVEEGEVVHPGTPLAKVANYGRLTVPLSVSNDEWAAIKTMPSEFNVIVEGQPATASINWVNPEFDEKSRKLNIELIISDYKGEKRGGLVCKLSIRVKTEGLFIPKPAVSVRYDNPTVILKKTGEPVQLLVIGESGENYIAAGDDRLSPGTELFPAGTGQTN